MHTRRKPPESHDHTHKSSKDKETETFMVDAASHAQQVPAASLKVIHSYFFMLIIVQLSKQSSGTNC